MLSNWLDTVFLDKDCFSGHQGCSWICPGIKDSLSHRLGIRKSDTNPCRVTFVFVVINAADTTIQYSARPHKKHYPDCKTGRMHDWDCGMTFETWDTMDTGIGRGPDQTNLTLADCLADRLANHLVDQLRHVHRVSQCNVWPRTVLKPRKDILDPAGDCNSSWLLLLLLLSPSSASGYLLQASWPHSQKSRPSYNVVFYAAQTRNVQILTDWKYHDMENLV